jgi:hypothetical protein
VLLIPAINFITGVVDTDDKFITGVIANKFITGVFVTGDKFIAGDNDTGEQLSPDCR